jgi:DNA mismatch repair ATPase MutS
MPRQIVRVITPGTVGEEMVLTAAEKSYLVAVTGAEGIGFTLAALDVSTGEFLATQVREVSTLCEEIARIAPREIVIAAQDGELGTMLKDLNCSLTTITKPSAPGAQPRPSRIVSQTLRPSSTNRSLTRRESRCYTSRTLSATTSRTSRRRGSTVLPSTCWWMRRRGGISS